MSRVRQRLTRDGPPCGARGTGCRIGPTSVGVQCQAGVDRPDFGMLFADMDVSDRCGAVPGEQLLQPRVEVEIAFVLGTDLDTPDLDLPRVRAAGDVACAALEIVDSRTIGWDNAIADNVADNASSGLLAPRAACASTPRLASCARTARRSPACTTGNIIASAAGSYCPVGVPRSDRRWSSGISRPGTWPAERRGDRHRDRHTPPGGTGTAPASPPWGHVGTVSACVRAWRGPVRRLRTARALGSCP
ncbi:2-keto-4-pentenoate hydratase [Streptomyces mirabilis]|uniref:2-keto-4-pentenoate hydratase n=1 Tax=Streptomyces mirabilis TaxID=68239 RepID=UPI0033A040BE